MVLKEKFQMIEFFFEKIGHSDAIKFDHDV